MIINRRIAAATAVLCAAGVLAPATAAVGKPAGGPSPSGLKQSHLYATDNTATGSLGDAVAVSGNTVVVGAYTRAVAGHTSAGAVDIFLRPSVGWKSTTQVATLTAPQPSKDALFGYSVAIFGRTIAVGAVGQAVNGQAAQGAVYLYTEPKGGWTSSATPTATLTSSDGNQGDSFGSGLAIEGSTIVVGADKSGTTFDGSAYVYEKPAGGWQSATESAQLVISAGSFDFAFFGSHVAISGNTIVVSAFGRYNNEGRAYVYVKPASGGWQNAEESAVLAGAQQLNAYFGIGIAIQGNTIVVGEDQTTVNMDAKAGAAYVFIKPAAGWTGAPTATATLTDDEEVANDQFGEAVALSGNQIAIGIPGRMVGTHNAQGAVDIFYPQSGVWKTETEYSRVTTSDGQSNDRLGEGCVAEGASFIVAGVREHNSGRGAAYVFAVPGPTLTRLSQAHKRWRYGGNGTRFFFSLTQPGTVRFVFTHSVGRKTKHDGRLIVPGHIGKNSVHFAGRIPPGHELVTVSAQNAYGATAPKHLRFTVLKARKH